MSVSAIIFLAVYVGALARAFVNPNFGLMAYLWAFYNYPEARWWGEGLPDLRWSLFAATITLIAEFLHRARKPPEATADQLPLAPSPPSLLHIGGLVWLITFAAWLWVQTPWALNAAWHFEGCMLFTKYVVLFIVIYRLLETRRSVELFAFAHIAGCFMWGWIARASNVGDRIELRLGPGVEDANTIGLHLGTGIMFAGLVFLASKSRLRWIAVPAVPFMLNGVILTGSRGAMLGLIAAGATALLFGPRQRRFVLVTGAVLSVGLFFYLAQSDMFWQRMSTLKPEEGQELEGSAASRFGIAEANWQMFLDYPLGVGHRGDIVLSPRYIPAQYLDETIGLRAAHNTMLAVLTNHGIPGAICYIALHIWAFRTLWRLKRLDRKGLPADLGAFRGAAAASLAALVVCGLFSNYIKAEVGIWAFALVAVLDRLSAEWEAAQPSAAPPSIATAAAGSAARSMRHPLLVHRLDHAGDQPFRPGPTYPPPTKGRL